VTVVRNGFVGIVAKWMFAPSVTCQFVRSAIPSKSVVHAMNSVVDVAALSVPCVTSVKTSFATMTAHSLTSANSARLLAAKIVV